MNAGRLDFRMPCVSEAWKRRDSRASETPAATNSKVAEAEDDEVLNDDGEDSEDEEDDYGIVNLDALRAQRLGGLFGAAPTHKAAVRQANDKKSSMQQRAPPARQARR